MQIFAEIFDQYSKYTGVGIFMVLFLAAVVYLGISEKNEHIRSVLIYGSITMFIVIFIPFVYILYTKFVDVGTYWRMFWLIPVGIGLAYVGTRLVSSHRIAGLLLILFVLLLGGRYVYISDPFFKPAENMYQLDQVTIELCDYLNTLEEGYINVAVPAELLTQIRIYDHRLFMPYGREQLDPNWGNPSGFFMAMNAETVNFETLSVKCAVNGTNYIVVAESKEHDDDYVENDFTYMGKVRAYDIYRYDGLE